MFDYIFMFPMGLGLSGAALATAFSPAVTMTICSTHFLSEENQVEFQWERPSIRHLVSLLPAWNFRLRGRAFFCNYYHYFQYADPGYCRKCRA
ncbi:MAG: hypothetical protein ACLU6Y_03555 [Ruminococcus sp.]